MRTIKESIELNTSPSKIYDILLKSQLHSELTGSKAELGTNKGDKFTSFDGWADGENLELIKNKKIVQSWRVQDEGWPNDHYSKITFILEETEAGTKLTFTHDNIPDDAVGDYEQGWHDYYWEPLKNMFNQ